MMCGLFPTRDRTCERGGGKGPCAKRPGRGLSFMPTELVRPAAGSQVRAGAQCKKGRALRSASPDARDRARPQPRSALPGATLRRA